MKRLISIMVAALLLALLVIPAAAAEAPESCVYDDAGLLGDIEYQTLEDYAKEVSQQRQCAVYFVTVDDFRNYGDGDIFNVARQIFLDNDFGMGEENSKEGDYSKPLERINLVVRCLYGHRNSLFYDLSACMRPNFIT